MYCFHRKNLCGFLFLFQLKCFSLPTCQCCPVSHVLIWFHWTKWFKVIYESSTSFDAIFILMRVLKKKATAYLVTELVNAISSYQICSRFVAAFLFNTFISSRINLINDQLYDEPSKRYWLTVYAHFWVDNTFGRFQDISEKCASGIRDWNQCW